MTRQCGFNITIVKNIVKLKFNVVPITCKITHITLKDHQKQIGKGVRVTEVLPILS